LIELLPLGVSLPCGIEPGQGIVEFAGREPVVSAMIST